MTKRPHIDIDQLLSDGQGTIRLDRVDYIVTAMSAANQHRLAGLTIGEGAEALREERLTTFTEIAAACLRPSIEPDRLRELPAEMLMAIITMANAPSQAVQDALAARVPEGNGQLPVTEAPAPTTLSAS